MHTIVWDESFSVGISEMDKQHKQLIEMVNNLVSSVENRESWVESFADTLAAMSNYAATHFTAEETLMSTHGFPQFSKHQAEHRAFRAEIVYLSDEIASHGATIPSETVDRLCRYLCNWLGNHILYTDMGYKAFFNEKGVRRAI